MLSCPPGVLGALGYSDYVVLPLFCTGTEHQQSKNQGGNAFHSRCGSVVDGKCSNFLQKYYHLPPTIPVLRSHHIRLDAFLGWTGGVGFVVGENESPLFLIRGIQQVFAHYSCLAVNYLISGAFCLSGVTPGPV